MGWRHHTAFALTPPKPAPGTISAQKAKLPRWVSQRTERQAMLRQAEFIRLRAAFKECIMADNLQSAGPQDRWQINVHEEWEVRYWTQELGVSKERLNEIVREVGTSVAAVRAKVGK
jgi:hypothetical protein